MEAPAQTNLKKSPQELRTQRTPGKFYDKSLVGVHEAAGGIEVFRRISERFHVKVESDPTLRRHFPKNMTALVERLALYLAETTGGCADYSATRGKTSLLCRHAHLAIGTTDAERWLEYMSASIEEEGIGEANRTRIMAALKELAFTLVDPCILLYDLPLESLRRTLEEDSSIAVDDRGRNLLRAASIGCDVPRMRLLLEFGVDVDSRDGGGHNALYRVANSGCSDEDGTAAIQLLIKHGADVNQVTGVGGMTPLHMAARRGTTQIAEALLDAGADVEAQDKNGETPLRRAVNCGQERIVRLLLSRGANPRSPDRNGRAPLDAARTESVLSALRGEQIGSGIQ